MHIRRFLGASALLLLCTGRAEAETVTLIKDIAPGSASSFEATRVVSLSDPDREAQSGPSLSSRPLIGLGSTVLFPATDSLHGYELWKTDGTAAGTGLVKDIQAAANVSSFPFMLRPWASRNFGGGDGMVVYKNAVYFSARGGDGPGYQLWKSDGSESGTVLVKDFTQGQDIFPTQLVVSGAYLFLTCVNREGGPRAQRELWRSDGTTAGTLPFSRIMPASQVPVLPRYLVAGADALYFTADDGDHGREVWRSDGTAAGTRMAKDILPGTLGSRDFELADFADNRSLHWGMVSPLVPVGGQIFFAASGGLWRSDGTDGGTTRVAELELTSPGEMTAVGSQLFFFAQRRVGATVIERGLWRSDGTAAGTVFVKDVAHVASRVEAVERRHSPVVGDSAVVRGIFYFVGVDGEHGRELWRSDGTAGGTFMVTDLNATPVPQADGGAPLPGNGAPHGLTAADDTLIFFAEDGNPATAPVYVSDGTAAGTHPVTAPPEHRFGDAPTVFFVSGRRVIFDAPAGDVGRELWTFVLPPPAPPGPPSPAPPGAGGGGGPGSGPGAGVGPGGSDVPGKGPPSAGGGEESSGCSFAEWAGGGAIFWIVALNIYVLSAFFRRLRRERRRS
jgi:ELWxxDGT repeat protein